MFDRELQELNSTWAYKYDIDQYASKEHWKIMKKHPYVGDCEDYALTLLYLISGKSMLKFWMYLITGKAQIRRVITKNGGGHAVLRFGDMWADNWTKKFVSSEEMAKLGHKKHYWFYLPQDVAFKLLLAKIHEFRQN
jgi:predicted transglutaminase-like cysteine proteinase